MVWYSDLVSQDGRGWPWIVETWMGSAVSHRVNRKGGYFYGLKNDKYQLRLENFIFIFLMIDNYKLKKNILKL